MCKCNETDPTEILYQIIEDHWIYRVEWKKYRSIEDFKKIKEFKSLWAAENFILRKCWEYESWMTFIEKIDALRHYMNYATYENLYIKPWKIKIQDWKIYLKNSEK